VTKRKPQNELRRRGRKPELGNDESFWIAIESRRRSGGRLGRARGSLSRAIDFIHADQSNYFLTTQITRPGLRKRYDRVQARRRKDKNYAAYLERILDTTATADLSRLLGLESGSLLLSTTLLRRTPGI
jgi:hypothetical protein